MKKPRMGTYASAGVLLLVFAILVLILSFILPSMYGLGSTLIISSMACVACGIFFLTVSNENRDRHLSSVIAYSGEFAACQILDLFGYNPHKSFFIPKGQDVQQLILRAEGHIYSKQDIKNLINNSGGIDRGIWVAPVAKPLIDLLKEDYGLKIPNDERQILAAIKETLEEVLEFADNVVIQRSHDTIWIDIIGHPISNIKKEVFSGVPDCGYLKPIILCSLIGCMLAEGARRVIIIDQVTFEPQSNKIHLSLYVI